MACVLKGSVRGRGRDGVIGGKDLSIAISWRCMLLLSFQSFRTPTVSNKILIFFSVICSLFNKIGRVFVRGETIGAV